MGRRGHQWSSLPDPGPPKRMATYPRYPSRRLTSVSQSLTCIEARRGHTRYSSDLSLNVILCVLYTLSMKLNV